MSILHISHQQGFSPFVNSSWHTQSKYAYCVISTSCHILHQPICYFVYFTVVTPSFSPYANLSQQQHRQRKYIFCCHLYCISSFILSHVFYFYLFTFVTSIQLLPICQHIITATVKELIYIMLTFWPYVTCHIYIASPHLTTCLYNNMDKIYIYYVRIDTIFHYFIPFWQCYICNIHAYSLLLETFLDINAWLVYTISLLCHQSFCLYVWTKTLTQTLTCLHCI